MYKKVLLPLDGSPLAESIIPFASQLAAGLGAEVTVLHVASPKGTHGSEAENLPSDPYLEEIEAAIRRQGVTKADRVRLSGTAADEITRFAESQGYDLIAMATHGRTGPGRWVFGSTADKVIHSTSLPMLLVRPSEHHPRLRMPIQSVLVPLDGSALAEMALAPARSLAQRLDLPITLVRVLPFLGGALDSYGGVNYSPQLDKDLEEQAASDLARVQRQLMDAGLKASSEVLRGFPSSQIIERAESTPGNLVVMSTHGRGGVSRWILGSVADRVVRVSHTPVLLTRAGKQ